MPIKGPASQHLKHLKTRLTGYRSKRDGTSPFNSTLNLYEYKQTYPQKLKDKVRVQGAAQDVEYDCVPFMTLMLSCLKNNNYDESNCSNEIKDFQNCYENYQVKMKTAMENKEKGIYKVDEKQKRYPDGFVNKLLSQYKQPTRIDTGPEDKSG